MWWYFAGGESCGQKHEKLEREIPDGNFLFCWTRKVRMEGGWSCCSRAVYTVNDEGFEEDCAVGRGASQFVNHSYSRMDTPEGGRRRRGYGGRGGRPRQTWRGGGGAVTR
jgi:hypothetical protein